MKKFDLKEEVDEIIGTIKDPSKTVLVASVKSLTDDGILTIAFSKPIYIQYPNDYTYYERLISVSMFRSRANDFYSPSFQILNITSTEWIL